MTHFRRIVLYFYKYYSFYGDKLKLKIDLIRTESAPKCQKDIEIICNVQHFS